MRNKVTRELLTPKASKFGYIHIGLYGSDGRKNLYVHRLVAEAFIPKSDPNLEVNHIDGNKANNCMDNLEWVTRSENSKHAFRMGLKKPVDHPCAKPVRIIETGEVFDSIRSCARAVDGDHKSIQQCLNGTYQTHKGLHYEYAEKKEPEKKPFLYPHQQQAVERLFTGAILNGGVGSGKSRTGLYYYFTRYGGSVEPKYRPMKKPPDLYIITTAKKRNDCEWEDELRWFLLSTHENLNTLNGNKIIVDSWQNIKKYADVKNAFFIFDEDHVTGSGAWVKAFLKITKSNEWIILSATAGDCWNDYAQVFIANGFFRNITEFRQEHVVYARYAKFPKIERYLNEGRLIRLRDRILIDMDFERHTTRHHEDVFVHYDIPKYKDAIRTRWDPFKNEPIEQAAGLCYVLRKIVNSDVSRQVALLELFEQHPRMIVFYNFDYELEILKSLYYGQDVEVAEYNGHKHEPIPSSKKWIYLVQYTSGCEGFNCIKTDCIVFYSQNYSYKVLEQACGRIDRLNTPYTDLYYYHLKTRSGIDLAISKALRDKKKFNERRWTKWDNAVPLRRAA